MSLVKVCYVLASDCSNTDAACVKEAFSQKVQTNIDPLLSLESRLEQLSDV